MRPLSSLKQIAFPLLAGLAFMGIAQAKNYPAARSLAGQLSPQGLTPTADPGGLGKARDQIQKILTGMEQSQVSGGPGANDLLETAYEMFVPKVGPAHRNAAVGTLTSMWTEARALGAFDEQNRFTGKITKGADAGQAVVFEYIVPMNLAPKFSRDVANVRLVPPSKKRSEGAKPTDRELAYVSTLQGIEREMTGLKSVASIENGPKMNVLGQTRAEAEQLWKEQMKQAGDKALQKPSIVLQSRLASTPSKRNGYKWVVQAEVTNMSMFPTEVEVECIFLGTTDKYRQNYVMGQPKQKLQMRAGQAEKLVFETPMNEGAYKGRADDYEKLSKAERAGSQASYRGAIIRVNHSKGTAATFATDPVMLDLLQDTAEVKLDSLPKLHLDAKTWPPLNTGK